MEQNIIILIVLAAVAAYYFLVIKPGQEKESAKQETKEPEIKEFETIQGYKFENNKTYRCGLGTSDNTVYVYNDNNLKMIPDEKTGISWSLDYKNSPQVSCENVSKNGTATQNPDYKYEEKYYLGKKCPPGWTDVGQAGIIIESSKKDSSPFNMGGNMTPGWEWTHPKVCLGKADPANMSGLYKFKSTGTASDIKVGFLGSSNVPSDIGTGSRWYQTDFYWKHPFLQAATEQGGYTISKTDNSTGTIGIISVNEDSNKIKDFGTGVALNKDWTWVHPFLKKD